MQIIETMILPKEHALPLVSQFKKLAGLNLSIHTVVQRGFLVFTSRQNECYFWTTTLPTLYGEKIVVCMASNEGLLPELRLPTNL